MPGVIFRVDAGSQTGYGHLYRCIALAGGFEEVSMEVVFVTNAEGSSILSGRRKQHYTALAKNIDSEQGQTLYNHNTETDLDIIRRLTAQFGMTFLIIDGYHFTASWFDELFLKVLKSSVSNTIPNASPVRLVLIDDDMTTPMQYAHLLFNPSPYVEEEDYYRHLKLTEGSEYPKILVGEQFTLLRPEFFYCNREKEGEKLLLTFGGSDPLNLSMTIIEILEQELSPFIPCLLITGPGYQHAKNLKKIVKESFLDIEHFHAVDDMLPFYQGSRLAISAAGSTVYELAATCTPSVLLVVAENQRQVATSISNAGWAVSINMLKTDNLPDLCAANQLLKLAVHQINSWWNDSEELDKRRAFLNRINYQRGAVNAAVAIRDCLLNTF